MTTLALHAGEIVGLAGLVGAGRTELLRLIFGADRMTPGRSFSMARRAFDACRRSRAASAF